MGKSLIKDISLNIISVVVSILSPLVLIPVLTKSLGLSMYGDYMALLALIAMFSILCDLGLDMYLSKEVSIVREDRNEVFKLFSQFLTIKVLISFFTLPIFAFLVLFTLEINSESIIVLASIMLLANNLRPISFFNGLEKYQENATFDFLGKVLLLALVVFLDFKELGFEKAVLIQVVSLVFISGVSYYYLYRSGTFIFKFSSIKDAERLLRGSFQFYAAKLFVNIYNQSSTYLVSLVVKSELVAIYSIGIQLYKVGQAVIGAITMVLYTRTVKSKALKPVVKITFIVVFLQAALLPIVFFYGEAVLNFILGIQQDELTEIIKLLYISLFFVTISSFWGYPVMVAYDKTNYAHAGIFFGSCVYFLVYGFVYVTSEFNLVMAVICILSADFVSMLIRVGLSYKMFILNKEN